MEIGYLRETQAEACRTGMDSSTHIGRIGLDTLLSHIFPGVTDWVHDRPMGSLAPMLSRRRPDYRSETLHMVVEFDGVPHYQSSATIGRDRESYALYGKYGYRVVRVPFFIYPTREAVQRLFGVLVPDLPTEGYPTLTEVFPADISVVGLVRMYSEFMHYDPMQLALNTEYLGKRESVEGTYLGSNLLLGGGESTRMLSSMVGQMNIKQSA